MRRTVWQLALLANVISHMLRLSCSSSAQAMLFVLRCPFSLVMQSCDADRPRGRCVGGRGDSARIARRRGSGGRNVGRGLSGHRGDAGNVARRNSIVEQTGVDSDHHSARRWFSSMVAGRLEPNEASFHAEMESHAQAGRISLISEWLDCMIESRLSPGVVSFNMALTACERAADMVNAERCFSRMAEASIQPDCHSFHSIISICAMAGELECAAGWMTAMNRSTSFRSKLRMTAHKVLKGFAQQGDVPCASAWFGKLASMGVILDVESYNIVLQTCAMAGDAAAAVEWFESMSRAGVWPNRESYIEVIRSNIRANDSVGTARWVNRLLATGATPCGDTYALILGNLAQRGNITLIERWLEASACQDIRCYVILITALAARAAHGDAVRAVKWLDRMEATGVPADVVTHNAVLRVFFQTKDVPGISGHLRTMINSGVLPDEISYSLVMRSCAEAGDFSGALTWLEQFELLGLSAKKLEVDEIVQDLARAINAEKAAQWAEHAIGAGCVLSLASYNALIEAFLSSNQSSQANRWLGQMGKGTVPPEISTYVMFIQNSASCESAEAAAAWHQRMTDDAGITPTAYTFRLVISAFAEAGDSSNLEAWIENLSIAGLQPDGALYSSVVTTLLRKRRFEDASRWFDRMLAAGLKPELEAVEALISQKFQLPDGALAVARLLDSMRDRGIEPGRNAFNLVFDGFAQSGHLESAQSLFENMIASGLAPDETTYFHMLECCGRCGDLKALEEWLQKMMDAGIRHSARVSAALARIYASAPASTIDRAASREASLIVDRHLGRMLRVGGAQPNGQELRLTMSAAMPLFELSSNKKLLLRWREWMLSQNISLSSPEDQLSLFPAKSAELDRSVRYLPQATHVRAAKRFANWPKEKRTHTHQSAIQLRQRIESLAGSPNATDSVVALFHQMRDAGYAHDIWVYLCVISCFATAGDVEGAVSWFEAMVAAGLDPKEKHFRVSVQVVARLGGNRTNAFLQRIADTAGNSSRKRVQRYDLITRYCAVAGRDALAGTWLDRAAYHGFTVTKETCLVAAKACLSAGYDERIWWWLRKGFWDKRVRASASKSHALRVFAQRYMEGYDPRSTAFYLALGRLAAWLSSTSLLSDWANGPGQEDGGRVEIPCALILDLAKLGLLEHELFPGRLSGLRAIFSICDGVSNFRAAFQMLQRASAAVASLSEPDKAATLEVGQLWDTLLFAVGQSVDPDPTLFEDIVRGMGSDGRQIGDKAVHLMRDVLGPERCAELCSEVGACVIFETSPLHTED